MRQATVYLLTAAAAGALLAAFAVSSATSDANYAADRAAIEDLAARYLFALDFRDPEAYASTFTEDGVLDYGAGEIVGRDAIREFVQASRDNAARQAAEDNSGLRPAAGRHNISNIVVRVDGDRATSRSYWFHMGNNNPERSAVLNSFGHYEDQLVKVDGEWLFSHRLILNEQVADWAASGDNPAW